MHLNQSASTLLETSFADLPSLECRQIDLPSGSRLIDCGVTVTGSHEAGLRMARVAMAGLGTVTLEPPNDSCEWAMVHVSSEHPVAACLASQYAGWKVTRGKYFAMGSGPMRAAIGREDLFDRIGMREQTDVAIGLLECSKLPTDEVCCDLATAAGVVPSQLRLLVARTASEAGTLQVIARSLETALHKLDTLHFDLSRVLRGSGSAPLAPVPNDDLVAIGRTNDSILYGGRVRLDVTGDDASLLAVGPYVSSAASPDFGSLFLDLFQRAGGDFYKMDPAIFAPAVIEFLNCDTGTLHVFGQQRDDIVRQSFL